MSAFNSILPINENSVQRTLEELDACTLDFEDLNKVTLNPLTCETQLLEHLAFSLDVSIEGLDEDEARAYLHNAREIKRYMGSVWAVNQAAKSVFGEAINVQPWNTYEGNPGTFKIDIEATKQKSVDEHNLSKAMRLINEVKRESAHLSDITIHMNTQGKAYVGAGTLSSLSTQLYPKIEHEMPLTVQNKVALNVQMFETVLIKPKLEEQINTSLNEHFAVASHTVDTMEVKPRVVESIHTTTQQNMAVGSHVIETIEVRAKGE